MNADAHLQIRQTIVRLLSSMASPREIDQYLKRFAQLDAKRFAVVKVGGAVLRDDLDALTSSLAFLQQVGLTPIVVHGAGPQLDEQLAAAGIEKRTVDGLRITSPEALAVVRRVFHAENLRLVEALQEVDARATSIVSGVFESELLDRDALGLVGRVSRVDLAPIEASLRAGSIPVIASLGETRDGQIVNVNADFAANELVRVLKPYKIIFLTGTGGLLDGTGAIIDSINLSTEYDTLMAEPWLHSGMRLKIEQIKDLLDKLPLASSVSITKPAELAKELFTHKGSGTLIRRGERVDVHTGWSRIDTARLRALIEASFQRKLAADYFERTKLYKAYVSENYRAALILTMEDGIPYLDKFAVADDAQGEGLGRAAWQVMRAENPSLFWRSRHHNVINPFYYAESDGCYKQPRWKHIASSQLVADVRTSAFGLAPRTFRVAPLPIDPRRFDPARIERDVRKELGIAPEQFVVIVVARLVSWKRADAVIRAVAAIERPIQLLVVGEGPEKERLEALAAELGIADRVRFTGRQDPPPFLAAANLFVLPSLIESLGLVYLEAMMMGLPCIGLKYRPPNVLSAAGEVVLEGEVGFCVGDDEELRQRIEQLAADPARCRQLGVRAREVALARYTPDQYVSLLGELAGRESR